jgi:hypothetical protein
MHDIAPWHGWRDEYIASEDKKSPFYGIINDEFTFTNKIYNYYIHPQWDDFGSETLYTKLLYVDYHKHFAMIELIGEWNDAIENDIMFLKGDYIDILIKKGITKFIIFCDNVLNYHGDDDSYYEEWYDDIKDEHGYIILVNSFDHVITEMKKYRLHFYLNFGPLFNDLNWRVKKPLFLLEEIENIKDSGIKMIGNV